MIKLVMEGNGYGSLGSAATEARAEPRDAVARLQARINEDVAGSVEASTRDRCVTVLRLNRPLVVDGRYDWYTHEAIYLWASWLDRVYSCRIPRQVSARPCAVYGKWKFDAEGPYSIPGCIRQAGLSGPDVAQVQEAWAEWKGRATAAQLQVAKAGGELLLVSNPEEEGADIEPSPLATSSVVGVGDKLQRESGEVGVDEEPVREEELPGPSPPVDAGADGLPTWAIVLMVVAGVGVVGGGIWLAVRRRRGGTAGLAAWSIEKIKRANEEAGRYFFSPGAMRFLSSRVGRRVYEGPGGVYFVTSERLFGTPYVWKRKYTVRRFDPATGAVMHVGQFQQYSSRSSAARAAMRLAAGGG